MVLLRSGTFLNTNLYSLHIQLRVVEEAHAALLVMITHWLQVGEMALSDAMILKFKEVEYSGKSLMLIEELSPQCMQMLTIS